MVARVLVSACLVGLPCAYDGRPRTSSELLNLLAGSSFLPVCPEILAGLGVPRQPAEIKGGDGFSVLESRARVFTAEGKDLTEQFQRAAEEALKIAHLFFSERIYLKEGSPS